MKVKSRKTIACIMISLMLVATAVVWYQISPPAEDVSSAQVAQCKTIVLDPGHGGMDGGATGGGGSVEKDVNLAVALNLRDMLRMAGYQVVMTREEDISIHDSSANTVREKKVSDIHNRLKILEEHPDSFFVSIHQNKFPQSQYSGSQVFYSVNHPFSETLAQSIQQQLISQLQPDNNRVIKPMAKGAYLLEHAKTPAVVVECGFLSNWEEEAKLVTPEYQSKLAFAIFCGITQSKGLEGGDGAGSGAGFSEPSVSQEESQSPVTSTAQSVT
ncbi:N-acetylmuramoyl-L-alanine amidase [Solibaculum mannosilyticum]|uniref:N-acetylmuramoyl-L-alanine amidase CwlD n=1 Tax=Solibaculum mannosilyticum TaxID=2780922 RepID=A0A7I8D7G8_9FIRM|nr:N-acetylmuramoyl-L-alanine amidase [Solibaculum mannosilyticum]BCI60574.1 N-acetylmuramoyl-L-alanine amidase CwlD [Solibaculum mannosilyticum]